MIVLQRGLSPILAERVKWYQDPEFSPAAPKRFQPGRSWWRDLFTPVWRKPSRTSVVVRRVVAFILGLILLAMANKMEMEKYLINIRSREQVELEKHRLTLEAQRPKQEVVS